MGKRKLNKVPDQRQRYKDYLNNISDTHSTFDSTRQDDLTDTYNAYVEVPPPIKDKDEGGRFISIHEFNVTYKVASVICGIVIVVVIPLVWFFSTLNFNVHSLQVDVKILKEKIETLWTDNILQKDKIDTIEKHSLEEHNKDYTPSHLKKR
ncbi:MAG: hypothetical protein EHM85_05705 [Desulfobacteraceae bacterium]|nr:MAG: hypothetical protein EHM85_05705 [Desulfobacteraceae bacterium]